MRDLVTLKTCSVCFIVLAVAACRQPAGNNVSGYQTNAAAVNEIVPPPENSAATNYTTPAEPAGAATAYQAFGTEPGWSLTIRGGRMRYERQESAPLGEPLPARTPIANGYRYAGRQITVEVVHRTCAEAGEESYPDEVRVTARGETLEGCGGRAGELG